MAKKLILCWNREALEVFESEIRGTTAEVHARSTLNWPVGHEKMTDDELGAWLHSQFSESGIKGDSINVLVTREMTMQRLVEVPHAPDDEIYDLIKFQAATKLSTPLDQLVIDYVPIDDGDEPQNVRVMVVALTGKTVQRIRTAVSTTDIDLDHIHVSSHALVEFACHTLESSTTDGEFGQHYSAIFAVQNQRLEFAIHKQGTCLFSHSTKLLDSSSAGIERSVAIELNRAALSVGAKTGDIGVSVVGTENPSDKFESIDISNLKSIRYGDSTIPRSVPILVSQTSGSLLSTIVPKTKMIDFLHPRRPQPKQDYKKEKRIAIAVGGVVLALLLWGGWQWRLSSLDATIAKLEKTDRELKSELKSGAPIFESFGHLSAWRERQLNYLEVIRDFNSRLPGTDQLYVEDLSLAPGASKALLRLTASGQAKRRTDVENTFDQMTAEGFLVSPSEIPRNLVDRDYPYHFDLDAALQKKKPQPKDKSAAPNGKGV